MSGKKIKIKQQAARIVNVTGPVKIRDGKVFDQAGRLVARVGIDLTEDDE